MFDLGRLLKNQIAERVETREAVVSPFRAVGDLSEIPQAKAVVEIRPIPALPSVGEMAQRHREALEEQVEQLRRELGMERLRVRELMEREAQALEQANVQARAGARAVKVASEGERERTDGAEETEEELARRLAWVTWDLEREREKVKTLLPEVDRLGDEVVALKEEKGRLHAQLVTKAAEAEKERERAEAAISREAEALAQLEKMQTWQMTREYAAPPVQNELHEVRLREAAEKRIVELQQSMAVAQRVHMKRMHDMAAALEEANEKRRVAESREAEAREVFRELSAKIMEQAKARKVETVEAEGEGRWP